MQLCMEASAAAGEKVRELFQEILMEPGQEKELLQEEPDEEPEEMQLPDIAKEYEKEYEEGHAWQMRTAEEMTRYFEINGTGDGISETKDMKYFRIIEECLEPDEYVVFTFMACHFSVNSEWEDSFANAITNKRLLMCKQVFFSGPILKVVPLEELNDIIITEGKAFSSIIVDSTKLQIRMETTVSGGKEIQKRLPTILDEFKKRNRELRIPKAVLASPADEIRKYKGLLDDGAITEAEYEKIKKELMKQAFTD